MPPPSRPLCRRLAALLCALCLAPPLARAADGPATVNYQASVKRDGQFLSSNGLAVAFGVYAQPEGGPALYREDDTVVVEEGLYATILGDNPAPGLAYTNLSAVLAFAGSNAWLGVALAGGAELVPRERLHAAPFVLNASAPAAEAASLTVSNLVAQTARFEQGIQFLRPGGDLLMGVYTNQP
jgi:hypothetical protein